jgi:Cof subfamily protein (haloacid dehalogenase superfamily)
MATTRKFKLVAIDLDGTLLNSQKQISENNRQTLNRLHHEHNVKIVLASGRMAERMIPLYQEIQIQNAHLIGYNGAKCISLSSEHSEHSVFFHRALPVDLLPQLFQFTQEHDLCLTLYCNGLCYAAKNDKYVERLEIFGDITNNVFQFQDEWNHFLQYEITNALFVADSEQHADELLLALKQLPAFQSVHLVKTECATHSVHQFYVEVLNDNVNKGSALSQLCSELNIHPSEVIVFGDGENDIEMFQFAGHAVCMQNGTANLKQVAHVVSQYTNNEDAIHHELLSVFQL